eukprot:3134902-Rhodomonas_salina.1
MASLRRASESIIERVVMRLRLRLRLRGRCIALHLAAVSAGDGLLVLLLGRVGALLQLLRHRLVDHLCRRASETAARRNEKRAGGQESKRKRG